MTTEPEVVDEQPRSTEVAVATPAAAPNLTNLTFADMNGLAKVFVQSGAFKDTRDVAMALVKIVAGQERGIPPMQAMTGIHVIKGVPVLAAGLIGALVKRSGRYNYRITASSADRCEITWLERGAEVGTSEFTIDQAKKAGLVKADSGWQSYPEDMLFARALTRGARRFCPDVFGGVVYAEGEDIPDTLSEPLPKPDAAPLPPLPRSDIAEQAKERPAEDDHAPFTDDDQGRLA